MADENSATVLQDGQLAVATVAQTGEIVSNPSEIDTTAVVQTESGKQLCVKTVSVGGGGGGGGTSDYTDLSNKPSINSVTLSGNKTGEDLGLLANTATQDSSLTVGGTSSSAYYATNVGKLSEASNNNAVAVGRYARATANAAIAIGSGTTASAFNAVSVSPGGTASGENSIQLGYGTNSTANTLQVWDKPLLDKTTGKIPAARMPDELLQNTATGTDSLTIAGTAATGNYSINIGAGSYTYQANDVIIGRNGGCSGNGNNVIVGAKGTIATAQRSVAIGASAQITAESSSDADIIVIGAYSKATKPGAIAIGGNGNSNDTRVQATAEDAIQIGRGGQNNNQKTLQVYSYQLLDGNTGLIPLARLGTGFDATKTQVLKHINGVATWVDEN